MRRATRGGWLCIAVAGSTALIPGCAWLKDRYGTATQDDANPILAAARAHQINLFGDIRADYETDYFTRSIISLKRHTFTEVGGDTDPALDSVGRRIVFTSTRHNVRPDLYIKSVDGVAVTQLTSDPASDVQPIFSPDDTRVAFASDRSGNWDIWVVSAYGGQPVQVTDGSADEVHPSWSPDGTKLVYCSLPATGGQWELWVAGADGGSTKKFIGYGLFPEWSPAGNSILFQRARERGSRIFSIWSLELVDGEPRYPTELASSTHQALILPTWSRDGRRIAFTSVEEIPQDELALPSQGEKLDIWMMFTDGTGKVRLTDGHTANHSPAFSASGRIFFSTTRSGHDNIWSLVPSGPSVSPPESDQLTGDPRGIPRTMANGAQETERGGSGRSGL